MPCSDPIIALSGPQGVEATLFATLMSILNGGSFTGSALGSGLTAAFGVTATNFKLLGPLIAVSSFADPTVLPTGHLVQSSLSIRLTSPQTGSCVIDLHREMLALGSLESCISAESSALRSIWMLHHQQAAAPGGYEQLRSNQC